MITIQAGSAGFFKLEPPNPNSLGYDFLRRVGANQPDARKNPRMWGRVLAFGPTVLRRTLEAGEGARNIADLGCGNGWLSLELARRHRSAVIDAVDRDDRAVEWAREYYERLSVSGQLAEVHHHDCEVEAFELPDHSYDLIVLSFVLGTLSEPGQLLGRVWHALRPGGRLVYYDATEAPPITLDRLATLAHRLARLRGQMSDPWNKRRRLAAAYLHDAVRRHRAEDGPPESHLFHRIEEKFEVTYQLRTRAFLDLLLESTSPRRLPLVLPLYKLADDLSVLFGYLEGACRFVVARKR